MSRISRILELTGAVLAMLLLAAIVVGPAEASFGPAPGTFDVSLTDDNEADLRAAGAHPNMTTSFTLNQTTDRDGQLVPDEDMKDIRVDLPAGLVGDPSATPRCPYESLATEGFGAYCPINTQIGVVDIEVQIFQGSFRYVERLPIFNMVPVGPKAAMFGFRFFRNAVMIVPEVRPDHGISVEIKNIPSGLLVLRQKLTIWGVPAAPANDDERFRPGAIIPGDAEGNPIPSTAPPRAFFTNPTECGPPEPVKISMTSWQHPNDWVSDEASLPEIEGCDKPQFKPSFSVKPTSHTAGSPTGLEVKVGQQLNDNPNALGSALLKKATVALPEGMTINAATATGLESCSEAQVGLDDVESAECPAASQIGSVEVKTPLLDHPIPGTVYQASQGANPFGSLLAMYLVFDDPASGTVIKLAGKIAPDPQTGRLSAVFDDNPQLPFDLLRLELKSGDRAPLVNPSACGAYTATADLSTWSRPDEVVSRDSSFAVDSGCGRQSLFEPGFEAGTVNPIAGKYSPFVLRVTRADAELNVSRIGATLPEGVLAKLAGVPLCGDAAAAAGDCPAGSQVGTATVGVGAGANPLYVPQAGKSPTAVYLGGPYKGAPYSLVVKVPAQAGPFDLGTVTVRNALQIDPLTTRVTASSDPLPQILQGIPVAYRDIRVDVDRPDFTVNPTSCAPMTVAGSIVSAGGPTVSPTDRFQAAGCERLGFKPKLAISLSGKLKRTGNPALKAVLTAPKGQANLAKTAVILPKVAFIDNAHINNPCTRVQFNAGDCPKASILGTATAVSPLLDRPLSGPVYFRSNGGDRELPDLVADLNGPIHVTVVGFIDSVQTKGSESSRVRTRFTDIPDAPVSKFTLRLFGGKRGLIETSVDLCKSPQRATVKMDGQNGKVHDFGLPLRTRCGKK